MEAKTYLGSFPMLLLFLRVMLMPTSMTPPCIAQQDGLCQRGGGGVMSHALIAKQLQLNSSRILQAQMPCGLGAFSKLVQFTPARHNDTIYL